jgi:excisionase family DNA binding protein
VKTELHMPDDTLEVIAHRVAELLSERQAPEPPTWLTIEEAAEHTRIPKGQLYKLTAAGAVPHSKPGNRLLFNRADLDAWLDDHREGPAPVRRLRAIDGGAG